jgi:predicted ATPase
MKYISFFFENYQGIQQKIDFILSKDNINTIIGNNESGKTTILKGIRLVYDLIQGLELQNGKLAGIRPKSSAFTGKITLGAKLQFNPTEIERITSSKGKRSNNELQEKIQDNDNIVSIEYSFDFINNQNRDKSITMKIGESIYNDKIHYGNILNVIKESCPRVEIYDDFEFEVPAWIDYNNNNQNSIDTINKSPNKKEIDWRKIFDNLLIESANFKGGNITFDSHIVKWLDENPGDQDSIDQRLAGINKYLNTVITKDWEDITESDITIKEFRINPVSTHANRYELKVISKNGNSFSITERSKGCRWFFCFKVVTEISKHQNKQGTLFLLDEPASNLHIHPQIKILNSLEKSERTNKFLQDNHHKLILREYILAELFPSKNPNRKFWIPEFLLKG